MFKKNVNNNSMRKSNFDYIFDCVCEKFDHIQFERLVKKNRSDLFASLCILNNEISKDQLSFFF